MHEEHLLVDEASPVVYPLELEAGLDGNGQEVPACSSRKGAIARKSFQEEITGIEAQHAEFGIAFVHLLAIPSAVAFGEVDGRGEQVVVVERGIEIGVEFEERLRDGLWYRSAIRDSRRDGIRLSGCWRTMQENWGSILINVRLLPDVGIKIFS